MENFFIDDTFITDLDDLIYELDIDEDNLNDLPDDWEVDCEETSMEPIFQLTEEFVIDSIVDRTETWEERFPEDSDNTINKIRNAIKQSIDIDKMNELLPKLYYPNGKKFKITKQDLINYTK